MLIIGRYHIYKGEFKEGGVDTGPTGGLSKDCYRFTSNKRGLFIKDGEIGEEKLFEDTAIGYEKNKNLIEKLRDAKFRALEESEGRTIFDFSKNPPTKTEYFSLSDTDEFRLLNIFMKDR